MSEDANTPGKPTDERMEKWIRIALAASLGANIFLGGFMAARMLGPRPAEQAPAIVDLNLRGLPQGLPSEVREELEDSMRVYRREIRHAYRDYRNQQREINRLLAEENLNEAAIAEAHEQLRDLNARIQGPMQQALIDAMREMDVETRRHIIELREVSKKRRFGRPKSVDGSRWRFDWQDDGSFQLEMDDRDLVVEIHPELAAEEDPEDKDSEGGEDGQ